MLIYNEDVRSTYDIPKGKNFIMIKDIECTNHIIKHGLFEKSLIEWSKQFCNKDKNVLDIGAHAGTYSMHLSEHCKTVYAFECQRRTYYQLCGNISINNFSNIVAHNVALSGPENKNKELTLRIISDDGGGSSILDLPINQKKLSEEKVICKTLDSFDISHISFIKIDVEGSELDVIRGAVQTLKRNKYPPILFEAWPDEWYIVKKKELFDYFEFLGYKINPINGYPQMFLATH